MRFAFCVYTPYCCAVAKEVTGAVRSHTGFVLLHWVIGNIGFRVVANFLTFNYGLIVRMGGRGLNPGCSKLRQLASSGQCVNRI
jgi:hypothetical protein